MPCSEPLIPTNRSGNPVGRDRNCPTCCMPSAAFCCSPHRGVPDPCPPPPSPGPAGQHIIQWLAPGPGSLWRGAGCCRWPGPTGNAGHPVWGGVAFSAGMPHKVFFFGRVRRRGQKKHICFAITHASAFSLCAAGVFFFCAARSHFCSVLIKIAGGVDPPPQPSVQPWRWHCWAWRWRRRCPRAGRWWDGGCARACGATATAQPWSVGIPCVCDRSEAFLFGSSPFLLLFFVLPKFPSWRVLLSLLSYPILCFFHVLFLGCALVAL